MAMDLNNANLAELTDAALKRYRQEKAQNMSDEYAIGAVVVLVAMAVNEGKLLPYMRG